MKTISKMTNSEIIVNEFETAYNDGVYVGSGNPDYVMVGTRSELVRVSNLCKQYCEGLDMLDDIRRAEQEEWQRRENVKLRAAGIPVLFEV